MKSAEYIEKAVRWIPVALAVGAAGGLAGALFVEGVTHANRFWNGHREITFLLPAAGILIVFLYRKCNFRKAKGTDRVLDKVRNEGELPFAVGPLIFISTVVTHLFGGSAGREGAAVQIGGSIGSLAARIMKYDSKDTSMMILCGVSALFAALFGTPLTAVFFALEVVSVGTIYYGGLFPCVVSSVTAVLICRGAGIERENWNIISVPDISADILLKVAVIGIMSAVVSVVIAVTFSLIKLMADYHIPNQYVRAVAGGLIIVGLSMVFSSGNYNGSGTEMIMRALEGRSDYWDFPLKLLFTAVTLGFGFKGGEIVPTFFMGACAGCAAGQLIGLDPGFAAALGLVATFCGCVNCPAASIIMAAEMFAGQGLLYFGICCALSYTFSGYFSLYKSQRIVYSKTRAELVNRNAEEILKGKFR